MRFCFPIAVASHRGPTAMHLGFIGAQLARGAAWLAVRRAPFSEGSNAFESKLTLAPNRPTPRARSADVRLAVARPATSSSARLQAVPMSEATALHAEIAEMCERAVLADRLRVSEILGHPRAGLNWKLAAALCVSGCTVARAQDLLETATWANAMAADDQPTDTRSNRNGRS